MVRVIAYVVQGGEEAKGRGSLRRAAAPGSPTRRSQFDFFRSLKNPHVNPMTGIVKKNHQDIAP
jgi:hypothetical protein